MPAKDGGGQRRQSKGDPRIRFRQGKGLQGWQQLHRARLHMRVTGNPGRLRRTPSLPAACRWHGSSLGTRPPLPPDSQLTAPPAPAQVEMQPPARHFWSWQTGSQWAEWSGAGAAPTLAQLLLCSAIAVPHSRAQRAPAPQLCRGPADALQDTWPQGSPAQMRCRSQRRGLAASQLPVPTAARSPPHSLGGGGIFSWLASACQLEYKGIICL